VADPAVDQRDPAHDQRKPHEEARIQRLMKDEDTEGHTEHRQQVRHDGRAGRPAASSSLVQASSS
jgi:hypothetical protein